MPNAKPTPDVQRVALLLAEGLDDRAVAKAEAITVRTVRRRVARLQATLGAKTRFQAGYLLAKSNCMSTSPSSSIDDTQRDGGRQQPPVHLPHCQ